ncbi:fimbrial protein [Paraburkholderia terrae]
MNKVISAGTISVPVSAPVGTTVGTLATDSFQPTCNFPASGLSDTSATLYTDVTTTAALASGFTDVYQTGIAGLGIRYTFSSPECGAPNATLTNGAVRVSCNFAGPLNGPTMSPYIYITPTLVVTGPIKSGASSFTTVPNIVITYRTSDGGANYWVKGSVYTGAATGTLTHATCSVNQSNVSVIMPTADTQSFSTGIGAVAAPQSFTLSLSCSTGATVLITLGDGVNPANRGTSLQLTSDSTAKGIGVQVVNSSGSPVAFGQDSATPGNANQWSAGASPNGTLQIPLTARYVRTGVVSAGTVKALATFTMSYQ